MEKTKNNLASLRERIRIGREKMANAKIVLKDHFIGIDSIIDQVFDNMEAWYLIPEAVTRPVIINLWGMTGVGKTDLVRKIASLLGFSDAYFEMQMSHTDNDHVGRSIATALSRSNIEQGKPGIVFLDEIQRFRAVDSRGEDMQNMKFQDVWILLSDGKFASSARKNEILEIILDNVYMVEEYGKERQKKKNSKTRKYHTSFYSAQNLKQTLHLSESIEEIMAWDTSKRMEMATNRLNSKDAFAQEDYSKLLVFTGGNIDEAYPMAKEVANGDIDADIFHEESKTINLVDIKRALGKRFKPEHISRFGNVHIIYPSLSKSSYRKLIKRHIDKFLVDIDEEHGIKMRFDESVNNFIYRNGVFPTQGVRPVFTTISSYIENSMPKIMMKAIDLGEIVLVGTYIDGKLEVYSDEGPVISRQHVISIPWVGVMDKIRDSRNEDMKTAVSVHEAGHSIIYAILFGHIPSQVLSSGTGFGGVTCSSSNTFFSRSVVLDKLCLNYAGIAAEELVFGKDMMTAGAAKDIRDATDLIVHSLKEGGLFGMSSFIKSAPQSLDELVNTNDSIKLNDLVEKICSEQRERAKKILSERLPLIIKVSDIMIIDGQIQPEKLQALLKDDGIEADLIKMNEMVISDYNGEYKAFSEKVLSKKGKKKISFKPAGIRMKKGISLDATKEAESLPED